MYRCVHINRRTDIAQEGLGTPVAEVFDHIIRDVGASQSRGRSCTEGVRRNAFRIEVKGASERLETGIEDGRS